MTACPTLRRAVVTPAEAGVQFARPVDSRFPRLREGDSGNDGARPTLRRAVVTPAEAGVQMV